MTDEEQRFMAYGPDRAQAAFSRVVQERDMLRRNLRAIASYDGGTSDWQALAALKHIQEIAEKSLSEANVPPDEQK